MDHGRFHPKAKSLADRLFHNECGGRVEQEARNWYTEDPVWRCGGCARIWSHAQMLRFNTQGVLPDRFHAREPASYDGVTLVEKTSGRVTYTALVPSQEADPKKKVSF